MTSVRFLAPAEEEMNASAKYYEQHLHGLGHRFLIEIGRAIETIITYPDSGHPFHGNYRRKLFGIFHSPCYIALNRTKSLSWLLCTSI